MKNKCLCCEMLIDRPIGKSSRGLRKFCSDACQRRHAIKTLIDPYEGIPFFCNKKNAVKSRLMMYCEETFAIVGYLKPICKLRE